jgi:hypothetical protein
MKRRRCGANAHRIVVATALVVMVGRPSVVVAQGRPSAGPSAATTEDAQALQAGKVLYGAGAQAYEKGQFRTAVQAFEEAYRVTPRPAILFNMAQAERKEFFSSRAPEYLQRAIAHYREYLQKVDSGARRNEAADALAELEPIAARTNMDSARPTSVGLSSTRLMVTTNAPSARVSLDGAAAVEAPLIAEVKAGKHKVQVQAPGFVAAEREVVSVAGSLVPVEVTLDEEPAQLVVETDGGAEVSIDGRYAGTTPLSQPIAVPAGERLVTVTKTGTKGASLIVNLERGRKTPVAVRLERTTQRTVSLAVLGAGALGVVAGGVFTGIAVGNEQTASDLRKTGEAGNLSEADRDRYNGAIASRDDWRAAAIGTFVASAGLLMVGAGLYFFDRPAVAAPERDGAPRRAPKQSAPGLPTDMAFVPHVGPTMGGALFRTSF